jgi:hypothetical protein
VKALEFLQILAGGLIQVFAGGLISVALFCFAQHIFAQAPQSNPQTGPQLNPYTQIKNIPVPALVFFWQVAQTMPPSCNQNLPGGTPGPPLYSFAVVQAPAAGSGIGDKLYIAMMGSQGTCEWVPWLTAP